MRLFLTTTLMVCVSVPALAHHPDKENQPVHRRIDVIPPLGNCLPMSYRRRYNRPSNWMGKITYHIAPSSQEAMAWHRATHLGYYKNHSPRMVTHYFYPKPWEALRTGARTPTNADGDRPDATVPSPYGSTPDAMAPADLIPAPEGSLDAPEGSLDAPEPMPEVIGNGLDASQAAPVPTLDESVPAPEPSAVTPPTIDSPAIESPAIESPAVDPPAVDPPTLDDIPLPKPDLGVESKLSVG